MRDRLMLEYPEKMCEYCCNFDKEHIGMDGTALCKLTMTLAYAEDYGGNCMFYNVPKEQIIVPPCKVGDIVYALTYNHKDYMPLKVTSRESLMRWMDEDQFGNTLFTTREEAEQALKGEQNHDR